MNHRAEDIEDVAEHAEALPAANSIASIVEVNPTIIVQ